MYEPITVEIDRGYGDGTYRSQNINFTGRLVQLIKKGPTTMRLYEWVNRGYVIYLVHVEEEKPSRRLPRHTLYPFSSTPTPPGPHRRRDTPQRKFLGRTRSSPAYPEFANEVGVTSEQDSDF